MKLQECLRHLSNEITAAKHSEPRPAPTARCCHLANITAWSRVLRPSILKVSKNYRTNALSAFP